jgi:hypothetical protein
MNDPILILSCMVVRKTYMRQQVTYLNPHDMVVLSQPRRVHASPFLALVKL